MGGITFQWVLEKANIVPTTPHTTLYPKAVPNPHHKQLPGPMISALGWPLASYDTITITFTPDIWPAWRPARVGSPDSKVHGANMGPIWGQQEPGPWFNIKMSSYQYRKSHCGDKTVVRSSYLHNGISYTGKMSSLYWFSPQVGPMLAPWTLLSWSAR